jgi:uncharacterized protein
VRFWDTSAVVPLLLEESATATARALYEEDPVLVVWWSTAVECASAIARLEREGALDVATANAALAQLEALAERWHEVQPVEGLRPVAQRLLRLHALRAADALQLAAAWQVAEHQPASVEVVVFDRRLGEAASREGFRVVTRPAPTG